MLRAEVWLAQYDTNLSPWPQFQPELGFADQLQLQLMGPTTLNVTDLGTIDATAFNMDSNLDGSLPDIAIVSSDHIRFCVHQHRLMQASDNYFGGLLPYCSDDIFFTRPDAMTVTVIEPAAVLDIMLHTVYSSSCEASNPAFDTIVSAIRYLRLRGVSLRVCLAKGAPLFTTFLNRSPLRPVEAFVVAAENRLEDLAVAISPLLLPVNVEEVSDEFADRMGGIYMRRLAALQFRRIYFLQAIIVEAPYPHASVPGCSYKDRQALARAWNLAIAALAVIIRPGKHCSLWAGSSSTDRNRAHQAYREYASS